MLVMTSMQSLRHRSRQCLAWLLLCVAAAGFMPQAYAGGGAPDATMPEWCSASMSASASDAGTPSGHSGLGGLASASGHHCALCALGDLVALPPTIDAARSYAAPSGFFHAPSSPLDVGLAQRPWLARAPPR